MSEKWTAQRLHEKVEAKEHRQIKRIRAFALGAKSSSEKAGSCYRQDTINIQR